MNRQYKSEALAATHEAALGLAEAGVMSKKTMRMFDQLCLTPVQEMSPADIRALRQTIFWETLESVRERNKGLSPDGAEALANEAVTQVRANRS